MIFTWLKKQLHKTKPSGWHILHDGYADDVSAYVTGCPKIEENDTVQVNLCNAT